MKNLITKNKIALLAIIAIALFLSCSQSIQPASAEECVSLTYDPNQGTGQPYKLTSLISPVKHIVHDNSFTRDGYTFVCWNTKANGTGNNFYPYQKSTVILCTTLYAQWKKAPLTAPTITYKANGGEGGDITHVLPGGYYTIIENPFTRKDYRFIRWNTKPDGTGNTYNPGDTAIFTSSVILYAIWTPSI